MYTSSYLLSSTGIRYQENGRHEMKWLPKATQSLGLTPKIIRERAEAVFQLLPGRIKNLALVNGNLSDFEMIQAAVEVAERYADNLMVITILMARITYALEEIARKRNPLENEVILIVTITEVFCEFSVLQRDQDFELNIIERVMYRNVNECRRSFNKFYEDFCPNSTVILCSLELLGFANDLRDEFRPPNSFVKFYKRWVYMLLHGSFLRVTEDGAEFDRHYHIPNFTMGIDTNIPGRGTGTVKLLLPERTRVPCNIYGFDGSPQPLTLSYFYDHYLMYEKLVYEQKDASRKVIWNPGRGDSVIAYYDERGVPFITSTKDETNQQKTNGTQMSGTSSSPSSLPSTEIYFLFNNDSCGIEILQNGNLRMLQRNGNDWTPLYLSMANGKTEVGEKAREDYGRFPKSVIFDVMKIIGKPVNEARLNPRWGFELTETEDGIIYFQIETPKGPRRIPQESVLSTFLKFLKLSLESSNLDIESVKEIRLSTETKLSDAQKDVFQKAADKIGLEIIAFH